MTPHRIIRTLLVLASFVLPAIGGAQPAEQADYESAVNRRYQGQYTPNHMVFESVLRFVARNTREKAARAIFFEFNKVQDEMGAWTYAPPESRKHDMSTIRAMVDELLAVRASIEEQKKQITQEVLCPLDRPYPTDDEAHLALDAQIARQDAVLLAAYRSFRGKHEKEVADLFDEWLAEWKKGYTYVGYDSRKVYELSGEDINHTISRYCGRFNSPESGP